MWRILCAVESGVDIVREGVRGCVTIRQLRTFQIFVTVDKRLFFLHNLSPINFGKVEANRVFWCLQKWLEIWPTDALNFFDYRSHLVDWGWLEFTSTENTKKLVTKWVIISGPKLLAHLKSGPISHTLYSLPFMKVFWKSWQLNLLEN